MMAEVAPKDVEVELTKTELEPVSKPLLSRLRSVVVENVPATQVVDEMVKRFWFVEDALTSIERLAYGVVVPMPRKPAPVIVVVPVRPNAAESAASTWLNIEVPVAFAKAKLPPRLRVPPKKVLPE